MCRFLKVGVGILCWTFLTYLPLILCSYAIPLILFHDHHQIILFFRTSPRAKPTKPPYLQQWRFPVEPRLPPSRIFKHVLLWATVAHPRHRRHRAGLERTVAIPPAQLQPRDGWELLTRPTGRKPRAGHETTTRRVLGVSTNLSAFASTWRLGVGCYLLRLVYLITGACSYVRSSIATSCFQLYVNCFQCCCRYLNGQTTQAPPPPYTASYEPFRREITPLQSTAPYSMMNCPLHRVPACGCMPVQCKVEVRPYFCGMS